MATCMEKAKREEKKKIKSQYEEKWTEMFVYNLCDAIMCFSFIHSACFGYISTDFFRFISLATRFYIYL